MSPKYRFTSADMVPRVATVAALDCNMLTSNAIEINCTDNNGDAGRMVTKQTGHFAGKKVLLSGYARSESPARALEHTN
jgi:hypothetical protein